LREKDGVPDLRLGARSKYASVASPEVRLISVKKNLQWYLIIVLITRRYLDISYVCLHCHCNGVLHVTLAGVIFIGSMIIISFDYLF